MSLKEKKNSSGFEKCFTSFELFDRLLNTCTCKQFCYCSFMVADSSFPARLSRTAAMLFGCRLLCETFKFSTPPAQRLRV